MGAKDEAEGEDAEESAPTSADPVSASEADAAAGVAEEAIAICAMPSSKCPSAKRWWPYSSLSLDSRRVATASGSRPTKASAWWKSPCAASAIALMAGRREEEESGVRAGSVVFEKHSRRSKFRGDLT